jgi:hypothetical protein
VDASPIRSDFIYDRHNCESFNGKLQDECLNQKIFSSWKEAHTIIEQWRNTLQYDPSALIAESSTLGTTNVCINSIRLDRDHINAVGSHPRFKNPSGQSAAFSTSVHGRTNRRHRAVE